jgi:hypothetical protein
MIRGFILALVAAFGAGPAAFAQNPPTQPQQQQPEVLRIRLEADHVTAEIRNSPLHHVLGEIAARTGIQFEIATVWNPPISLTLYRAPVEDAIRRILASGDSMFYFAKDAAGQSRIRRVRAFPRGLKGQPASLQLLGTGQATKSGDDATVTIERAFKALSEDPNVDVRQKAVEVIATVKGDAAVSALTLAVADKAAEVRVAAIEGLAGMGAREALPRIVESLKDKHPGVRQSAVEAVAVLGGSDHVKDLKPLLRDRDASVANAASLAMRRLSERHP